MTETPIKRRLAELLFEYLRADPCYMPERWAYSGYGVVAETSFEVFWERNDYLFDVPAFTLTQIQSEGDAGNWLADENGALIGVNLLAPDDALCKAFAKELHRLRAATGIAAGPESFDVRPFVGAKLQQNTLARLESALSVWKARRQRVSSGALDAAALWELRYSHNGKQVPQAPGTSVITDANKWVWEHCRDADRVLRGALRGAFPARSDTDEGADYTGCEQLFTLANGSEQHTFAVVIEPTVSGVFLCASYRYGAAPGRWVDLAAPGSVVFALNVDYEPRESHFEGQVWIGSGRIDVHPEALRGIGLGSLFMRPVVAWIKSLPEVPVTSINLQGSDATPDNHHRRNRFYEKLGFRFVFEDLASSYGESEGLGSHSLLLPSVKFTAPWTLKESSGPDLLGFGQEAPSIEWLEDARSRATSSSR